MGEFGVLSLLPPLVAIVLAFLTRNVLLSLFCGVLIGSTMAAGWNPIIGFVDSIDKYIISSMADSWNASVLLFTLLVGAFSALLERGGGAIAFGKAMEKKIHTAKQAQIISWLSGIGVFFSDASNSVIIGPILKPVTDRLKVSREKLAYICDSTSAAVPLLIPITAWGAFIMGIYKEYFPEGTNLFLIYIKSIPFNLYTISAILMVAIIAITGWDFGPMRKAEERARIEGKVLADGASPLKKEFSIEIPDGAKPTIWDMILPIITLVLTLFIVLAWTGGFPQKGFVEAISNGRTTIGLAVSFFVGSIVASFMSVRSGVLKGKVLAKTWSEGFAQMAEAVLILILSWSIGSVTKQIGTAAYIVEVTKGIITPAIMFITIFVAASLTSFSTGTSWGTFAIFLPIAVPLAIASNFSVYPAIGAVLAGGLFGDHCSPISDTTILSSLGASCDHVDHVKTQLPYALCAAIASAVGYIVAAITNNGLISVIITLLIMTSIAYLMHKFDINKGKKIIKEES